MLSATPIVDIGYYLGHARYVQADAPQPGEWFGRTAEAFGLTGEVQPSHLRELFRGFAPSGESLLQNSGAADRRPGWDFTFSCPKSVSVLWAVADEPTRLLIKACHAEAVRTALAIAEEHATWARKGKAGRAIVKGSLAAAIYCHDTSRAGDPAVHSHCLLANLSVCEDGKTRALHSQPLYVWKMTLGALYRHELAHQLATRLGLPIQRTKHGFEIRGVPHRVLQHFSKRRQAVVQELLRRGRYSAAAAEAATLATRQAKSGTSEQELAKIWRSTSDALRFTANVANSLLHSALITPASREELVTAIGEAITRLTTQKAHFTQRDLLRELATAFVDRAVPTRELEATVNGYLQRSQDIVHLQEIDCERQYTTRQTVEREAELLRTCDDLERQTGFRVTDRNIERILANHVGLRERHEQVAALRHILAEGLLKTLPGAPGTGKTFILKAAREILEAEGYRVIGTALAGRAARELQVKAGIKSDTLAKLLRDLEATALDSIKHDVRQLARAAMRKRTFAESRLTIDARTVVIVDEMGMVDTPDARRLLVQVAKAGAKIIFVGDPQQLPAIGPGAPFRTLLGRYDTVYLDRIERQKNPADVQAIHAFSRGNIKAALTSFQKRALVTVADDRKKACEQLVGDWAKHGGVMNPGSHAILVCTNSDRIRLNDLCQRERMNAGALHSEAYATIRRQESIEGEGSRIIREDLHVGDRVMALERSRRFGIENGDMGTVVGYDRATKSLAIRFEQEGTAPRLVTVPVAEYPHLTLGYAATTHKLQGATVDHSYVLLGGSMQSREMTYTQITRAKHATRLYADVLDAGRDLKKLISTMERSQAKLLAHELLQRPQHAAVVSRQSPADVSHAQPRLAESAQQRKPLPPPRPVELPSPLQ